MSQAKALASTKTLVEVHQGKFRGAVLVFDGKRHALSFQQTTFDKEADEYRNVELWISNRKQVDDAIAVLQQTRNHLPEAAKNGGKE